MNPFWKGVLSLFDVTGSAFTRDWQDPPPRLTDEEALAKDREALARDRKRVLGEDL